MNPRIHRGVRSIRQRLDLIAQRINLSVTTPQLTLPQPGFPKGREYMLADFAGFIVRGTAQHGGASETAPIEALFRYVKNNIEYRQDPADYDYYRSAGRVIAAGFGDCDCMTILTNSLLSSIGYTTGARVISSDGQGWHIYSIVGVEPAFNGTPTKVIPLDAAFAPDADSVGWEPPMNYRQIEEQCTFKGGKVVNYFRVRG